MCDKTCDGVDSFKSKLNYKVENSLLGSKTLGTKVIRTLICVMLANHDQKIESRFRLAQSMFICKIGIEWLQNLLD